MRSFAVLVGHEIREWQGLVWTGALLGAIGWAAPWLPGMGRVVPAEARQATAAVLALFVCVLGPIIVGSNLVGRDLLSGRFGFFLSLPVGPGRLWAAKVGGAAATVYLALLLVSLPGATAITFASDFDHDGATVSWWAFIVALTPLALLLLSHLFGLAFRARNAWLAVDVVVVALVGGAAWYWATKLWTKGAVFESVWGLSGLFLLAVGGLLVAGWRQLRAGDLLLERARLVHGRWAWSLLLAATLAFGVWTWWVLSAKPSGIVAVKDVVVGPSSDLLLVRGEVRGRPSYEPWFLLYGEEGWANVGWAGYTQVHFSADGQKAAWGGAWYGGPELTVVEIAEDGVRFISPEVPLTRVAAMAFSPDGEQIAAFTGSDVVIFDLRGGGLVASHRVMLRGDEIELYWPDEERIRIVSSTFDVDDPTLLQVAQIDLRAGEVTVREPTAVSDAGIVWKQMSPDGSRLLVLSWSPRLRSASLRRSLDAAAVATFGSEEWGVTDASFLGDGRVALAEVGDGSSRLRLVDADGVEVGAVEMGEGAGLRIAGEHAPGQLVLTLRHDSEDGERTTLYELDTERSPAGVTVLDEVEGRLWLDDFWRRFQYRRPAGTFVDSSGSLRRFDFRTRSWWVLVGPGS